jgi:hypothetical protein
VSRRRVHRRACCRAKCCGRSASRPRAAFYDWEAKYFTDRDVATTAPAALTRRRARHSCAEQVRTTPSRPWTASGWGRVDFLLLDADGTPQLAGGQHRSGHDRATAWCRWPQRQAGIGFDELVWRVLETSVEDRAGDGGQRRRLKPLLQTVARSGLKPLLQTVARSGLKPLLQGSKARWTMARPRRNRSATGRDRAAARTGTVSRQERLQTRTWPRTWPRSRHLDAGWRRVLKPLLRGLAAGRAGQRGRARPRYGAVLSSWLRWLLDQPDRRRSSIEGPFRARQRAADRGHAWATSTIDRGFFVSVRTATSCAARLAAHGVGRQTRSIRRRWPDDGAGHRG